MVAPEFALSGSLAPVTSAFTCVPPTSITRILDGIFVSSDFASMDRATELTFRGDSVPDLFQPPPRSLRGRPPQLIDEQRPQVLAARHDVLAQESTTPRTN